MTDSTGTPVVSKEILTFSTATLAVSTATLAVSTATLAVSTATLVVSTATLVVSTATLRIYAKSDSLSACLPAMGVVWVVRAHRAVVELVPTLGM